MPKPKIKGTATTHKSLAKDKLQDKDNGAGGSDDDAYDEDFDDDEEEQLK